MLKSLLILRHPANAIAVEPADTEQPDELVMAQRIEGTAFARIEKFEDNKTEQVWELLGDEFRRAVISADGETAWKLVGGSSRIRLVGLACASPGVTSPLGGE